MSEDLKIPYQTLRNYEIGKRNIGVIKAFEVSEYLCVPIEYLFGYERKEDFGTISITNEEYERLKEIEKVFSSVKKEINSI